MKFVRAFLKVNLDYSTLVLEFSNHPSVREVSEKAELVDRATAKSNMPSLPTVAV